MTLNKETKSNQTNQKLVVCFIDVRKHSTLWSKTKPGK